MYNIKRDIWKAQIWLKMVYDELNIITNIPLCSGVAAGYKIWNK